MAMKLSNVSQKDYNGVVFLVIGDGVASSVKVDLAKPPFLIDFLGAIPVSVTVPQVGQDGVTATATLTGSLLEITFSQPIEPGISNVNCEFQYASA